MPTTFRCVFLSITLNFSVSPMMSLISTQTISKEKLKEGVESSCALLLVLNDETLSSTWCQYEIDCARYVYSTK